MTRSFDVTDVNVVTTPGGQRVHKGHAAQSDVIKAEFYEVRAGVWCLVGNGLSNQTFIDAPEGIIAVDTGESIEEMREALRRLREVTDAPIAAVIYTHFHYVEGTKAILEEGNHATPLPIYGHEKIAFNKARTLGEISPAYSRGLVEQFAIVMPLDGPDATVNVGLGFFYKNPAHAPYTPGHIPVTEELGDHGSLTIAGLPVQYQYSPSDSDDSINFYFPSIGTCIHNSVWPVLFNVFAIRGEEYRDPRILIPGIDNIIKWAPEYLVATHGPALTGKDNIREKSTRYRDSIQFMWDQTVRGINKGWTADEIASRITLPESYDVDYLTSERYGVTEHHLRQIFMGLRGWFDGNEEKLFPEVPESRYEKLIAGFGGRETVRAHVSDALATNDVRWATEMATWLARSVDAPAEDRALLASCLRVIAERTPAANIRNWAITRARHLDGSFPMDRFMQHGFNPKFLGEASAVGLIHTLRVLVDPDAIDGVNHHVAFVVGDETAGLHVRNSVAVPTDGWGAQSMVKMSRATLLGLLSGRALWSEELASGAIAVSGDNDTVDCIRRSFENKGFAG
ncbi:MAG: MBL fold metallo-hydrolase [Ilumatobacteraceae bacterium]|jgi:alkyl sulfatase BDS1-like metallo-beta-lactamase superfamily hydrolase|nr:MBL fold metallo-hydrolase [Ilumatobacteraceae bacterium]